MAKSTGVSIIELSNYLSNSKPDIVITIADRYENLSVAIAASYMNIPVAHIQGGETTGSIDEKVRHAITKMSDLHFVSTKRAKKFEIELNLKQMKLDKEKNRLKNLDRNLQQFGEDCETQRELNEEEDIRLKKENEILSERKTCVDALEKRVKEMKVVYEKRMNMM